MFVSLPPPKRLHSITSNSSDPNDASLVQTAPSAPDCNNHCRTATSFSSFFLLSTGWMLLSARTETRSKATLSRQTCNRRIPTTRWTINDGVRNNICNLPDCCVSTRLRDRPLDPRSQSFDFDGKCRLQSQQNRFSWIFSLAGNRRLCPPAS